MKSSTKRLRILLESLILALLVGLLLAVVALSSLDIERYRGEIVSAVSNALGADVTAGRLKPSLFPYFGVEVQDLTALHREGAYEIDADEVIVGVSLWKLVSKEVVPRKIKVSSVDICIFLAEDESVSDSLAAFFNRPVMNNGEGTGIRDILFEDAAVCVYDGGAKKGKAYRARIFRAWLFQRPKKRAITFAVSLAPPGEGGRGRISAFGEYHPEEGLVTRLILREMDLDTLSLWFNSPGDPDISGTLGGSVDMRYLDPLDWAMEGSLKVEDVSVRDVRAYPDGMYIERLHVGGLVTSTEEKIVLDGMDISSDELDVSLDCVLDRAESADADDPGLLLDVLDCRFEGVDIEKYLRLIPYGLLPPEAGDRILALFFGGVLDGSLHIAPEAAGSDGAGLSLSARVTDATLDLGGIVLGGVRADVGFDGDTVTVTNVGFADPANHVRELGALVIDTFDRPYMDRLVVDIEEIPYEDLKDILVSGVVNTVTFLSYTEGEGTVWGRLEISCDMGMRVGPLVIEGDVNFVDWAVALPSVNGIFAPTDASIIFHDDTMTIPVFEMRYPTSHLIASGKLTNYTNYEDPLLVMDISAPVLDLVELFGDGESRLLWNDVNTTLIYQEKYFILDDLTCSAYGGTCRGDFGYVAEEADGHDEASGAPVDASMIVEDEPGGRDVGEAIFYLNMEGDGVDVGALMEDTGQWHGISGTGSFTCSLTSAPVAPEEIMETLDGTVSMEIRDGALRQYNALSKIISVMNISNYFNLRFPRLDTEGFPFDVVTGDFTVEDGVAHTENLFIDSRVIHITCVGDVDMVRKEVDMIIGFQILKTVDLVINKIPVVGYILTGEDGNLFTTYFHIYGPLEDPVVDAMTLQSLGEGTLHIFERIYRFPFKGLLPR